MSAETSEPTKRCPDCAETVLADARVCRYCGYRFAPPPSPTADAPRSGFGLLRARPSKVTLEDLLETWGDRLAAGEQADPPIFASLGKADGYLLVTDRRVAFFGIPRRESRGVLEHIMHPPPLGKLAELRLDELTAVEVGGWPRTWVVLRGAHDTLEISGLSRSESRRLAERLRAAIDAPSD